MTQLERQVGAAQHRLWFNRWLTQACWCLASAAGTFAVVVLVQRLFGVAIPLLWTGTALAVGAVLASVFWTSLTRESPAFAAARLDEAAGLRERLSSGRFCVASDDPFARAVVTDAERTSASLSARQHIRLIVPRPLALTSGVVLMAALMFLVPRDLLKRSEATESGPSPLEARQTQVAVKRTMDQVRTMGETNSTLEDLVEQALQRPDNRSNDQLKRPGDIRHTATKKIDRLQDAIKRKRKSSKYGVVNEMRKRMRGIKAPKDSAAPTQKLAKALTRGDFKTAREEIESLKEKLATLKSEQDKEMVAKMSKQLDDLSKQIEQLAKNKKLAQQLEQAGIKKEDVDRMLENLRKRDLDQLKKQLEKKGWDQQQIQQAMEQLRQQQQAGSMAQKMSQAMKQASKCNNPNQMGEAMSGLTKAGEQLSELEQLEQEMNELGSAAAQLQNLKDDIENQCPQCNGTGEKDGKMCGL